MWSGLSHFAGVRRADGVRGFQGTYDTIRLVISHLSSHMDNSKHHCQATQCSAVLHGTAWATSTQESGSWKGEERGTEWRGAAGEGDVARKDTEWRLG